MPFSMAAYLAVVERQVRYDRSVSADSAVAASQDPGDLLARGEP